MMEDDEIKCEDCKFFDDDDGFCRAFECNGLECPTLPCEESPTKCLKSNKIKKNKKSY